MEHKDQIISLRQQGKTYNQIVAILGCSKGTVAYHCGEGQKEKCSNRQREQRIAHCLTNKATRFKNPRKKPQRKHSDEPPTRLLKKKTYRFQSGDAGLNFSFKDILEKYGTQTQCYLSGRSINLMEPRTYSFDHITPTSKGGVNSLENLGVTCREANMAKSDLLVGELIELCKDILEHQGFKVIKDHGMDQRTTRSTQHRKTV